MKIFIFSVLFVLSIQLKAEAQNVFANEIFHWDKIERKISFKNKIDLINNIPGDLVSLIESPMYSSLKDNIDDFHFIDINHDGYLDIIYNGYAGGEMKNVLVYLHQNNTFVNVLNKYGRIIDVYLEDIYSNYSIRILDFGFDESSVSSILNLKLVRDMNKYILVSKLNYIEGTKLPKLLKSRNELITTTVATTSLYKKNDIKEQHRDSLVVAKYPKGSLGVSVYEHVHDNIFWCFVIMYNNKEPVESLIKKGNNDGSFFSAGWVKKDDLVYLE